MKKARSIDFFRLLVHIAAWQPLLWLLWDGFHHHLTANPIQALEQRTGKYALVMLVASLLCTPLNTLFGFRRGLTVQRAVGLYAFGYASLHFLIFIGIDYGFDLALLYGAIFTKPYILLGLAALVILTLMAITSFRWWQKRLKKNWKRLHRLVYLAASVVVLHFALSMKGNLLRLQGNLIQPLQFGLVVGMLLLVRLPPVRKAAVRVRAGLLRAKPWQIKAQASQKILDTDLTDSTDFSQSQR